MWPKEKKILIPKGKIRYLKRKIFARSEARFVTLEEGFVTSEVKISTLAARFVTSKARFVTLEARFVTSKENSRQDSLPQRKNSSNRNKIRYLRFVIYERRFVTLKARFLFVTFVAS